MRQPLQFIFSLSQSRRFRIALLCFQFIWLNVIVPGHRRGIVALSTSACESCDAPIAPAVRPCCSKPGQPSHPTPADPAAHCAVCHFAARLSQTAAVDFTHPPLRFIALLRTSPAPVSVCPALVLSYHGRAPPVSA